MSVASSPSPKNLLVLAALGIGVYWFMTRGQALAGTRAPVIFPSPLQNQQYAQYSARDQALWGTVGGILGKGADYLFGSGSPANNPYFAANAKVAAAERASAGAPNVPASGDPYNPDGYYTSSTDSLPVNPPGDAAYDWFYYEH